MPDPVGGREAEIEAVEAVARTLLGAQFEIIDRMSEPLRSEYKADALGMVSRALADAGFVRSSGSAAQNPITDEHIAEAEQSERAIENARDPRFGSAAQNHKPCSPDCPHSGRLDCALCEGRARCGCVCHVGIDGPYTAEMCDCPTCPARSPQDKDQ